MDGEPQKQETSTTIEADTRKKFDAFYTNAVQYLRKSNKREPWIPEETTEVFTADIHNFNINGINCTIEMRTPVEKGTEFPDEPDLIELDVLYPESENLEYSQFNLTHMTRAQFVKQFPPTFDKPHAEKYYDFEGYTEEMKIPILSRLDGKKVLSKELGLVTSIFNRLQQDTST